MAPPATNWLSFSLTSPMEALTSSSSASSHHHHNLNQSAAFLPYDHSADSHSAYLIDGFYHHDLSFSKPQILYSDAEAQIANPIPKLEDFLGDSQTETQDSSLTHIYDHGHGTYFATADHQDLKAITGFQSFSTNSGSEVDDSASMGRANQFTDFTGGHTVDSSGNELAFSACGATAVSAAALSLAVVPAPAAKNAVVAVDSDCTKKVADTFGQRTSIYRGVTRHRWTGRYEAHLWDNSCRREGQARKGRQVYLGGYDKEDKAARAYDLAALKYWGPTATTNFPVANYAREVEEMKNATKQEFIASLRRKSSGFSRGASIYRGVTRHHQQGRWQARIGRVAGNKDLYLGTFATEEEAAEAYDIAAIKFRGINAVTNFEMNRYDVEAISSSNLPIGGAAKRLKLTLETEQKPTLTHLIDHQQQQQQQQHYNINNSNNINFGAFQPLPFDAATAAALYHHHQHQQNSFHHFQPLPGIGTTNTSMIPVSSSSASVGVPAEFYLWPHQNC